jgi:hypothetical protein
VFLWLCWNKIVVIGNFSFFSKDCSHVASYVLLWICWSKNNSNSRFFFLPKIVASYVLLCICWNKISSNWKSFNFFLRIAFLWFPMCSDEYDGTKKIEIGKFVGKYSYVKIVPIYVRFFLFFPRNLA